jgi:hypothetical protein
VLQQVFAQSALVNFAAEPYIGKTNLWRVERETVFARLNCLAKRIADSWCSLAGRAFPGIGNRQNSPGKPGMTG